MDPQSSNPHCSRVNCSQVKTKWGLFQNTRLAQHLKIKAIHYINSLRKKNPMIISIGASIWQNWKPIHGKNSATRNNRELPLSTTKPSSAGLTVGDRIRSKAGTPTFTTSLTNTGGMASAVQQARKIKVTQIGKEKIKLSLFQLVDKEEILNTTGTQWTKSRM